VRFQVSESAGLFWDQALSERALESVRARDRALPWRTDGGLPSRNVQSAVGTRERFGAPNAVGAISYPGAALSAYKLRLRPSTTGAPVGPEPADAHSRADDRTDSMPKSGGIREQKWIIQTDRGQVVAERVILTTNAYANHRYRPLQHIIISTQRPSRRRADPGPLSQPHASRVGRVRCTVRTERRTTCSAVRLALLEKRPLFNYRGGRRKAAGMELCV